MVLTDEVIKNYMDIRKVVPYCPSYIAKAVAITATQKEIEDITIRGADPQMILDENLWEKRINRIGHIDANCLEIRF